MPPHFHATPPEALTGIVRDLVLIDDKQFLIDRPADADLLLNHPTVRAAYATDDHLPHWTSLWPASRMLAKVIVREKSIDRSGSTRVLEIGCGLGLAGIAALSQGWHVTFSDLDETALAFAAANARLNGFENFTTEAIDIRHPPENVTFALIIGSDLLYEARLIDPLVRFLNAALEPGGLALITDPDRTPARIFRWKLVEGGFEVAPELIRAGEPGGERTKGTLYRIRKPIENANN